MNPTYASLRDAAMSDLTVQDAAGQMAAAIAAKVNAAAARVEVSSPAFAAAIKAAGGELIDVLEDQTIRIYRSADGASFTANLGVSVDAEMPPAPSPKPTPAAN